MGSHQVNIHETAQARIHVLETKTDKRQATSEGLDSFYGLMSDCLCLCLYQSQAVASLLPNKR
jgi:hypothetical protein